ncbi:Putative mitochondrial ATP-dependent helicase irc3 [Cytospora mali]|uniref:Mitochondrial ATP-dependent helicase irc3 n=1 Tax=Cytospora mali TaxID=578113 RepID=A0A194UQ96_CYTMA|nr:Putative mitochondrial ATP-dependent helicase irc3 [Valsa mali var. pyri (nom. inval.)]
MKFDLPNDKVIFTQLISHIEPPSKGATQTLILAHRRELVEQAARHCNGAYPDKKIEIDMASSHASGVADITVASVASLQRSERLQKYNPKKFKLVLVDEAHHIVAAGYMKILEHFGLSTKRTDSPNLVGVSATFSRFDGLKLGTAIDEIVYHKDYVDMIDEKWLTGVIFTTVKSTADITKVKKQSGGGDFVTSELSRAVNTDQVNEVTVRSWLAKAGDRKSTLVFCVDLAHVAGLTAKFRQFGIDARFVTGDTHKLERGEILDAFKRGDFPVLLNCGVFTEGTDIPNIDCVVLARPTRSRNLLVQMIGRGMRLHHGKENCHIMDMVSSLETGIVTVPTLFGLDPSELVDNASVDDMKSTKERKEDETTRHTQVYDGAPMEVPQGVPQKVTFTEYESVFDLITDTSGERHINSLSQYSWVQVGHHKYVLTGGSGTYLRLMKDEIKVEGPAMWRAFVIRALPAGASKSPFAPPQEILKATTFSDAVHGADKYARKIFPHVMIARKQPWREGTPTEGQLKFLNKLRPEGEPITADDITKGKAADMITKLKHGARGRFADLRTTKRKMERQVASWEQEQERKRRERVVVGPVVS